MRGQVAGQAFKGTKPSEITRDLKLDRSTVNYTFQQDQLRDNRYSLPRTPRGKSYTDTEKQLLRYVRLNPKNTYEQIIAKHGYSARSYLEVCEAEVVLNFEDLITGTYSCKIILLSTGRT
jgi:hypothetical protein